MARDVFLLGAGFSRAISPRMPLVAEVGGIVKESLAATPTYAHHLSEGEGLLLRDFEVWLSSLAENQPYRTQAENLGSQALFTEVVAMVARELRRRVTEALRGSPPDWLEALIAAWHANSVTVITLNYDHLVEASVDSLDIEVEPPEGRTRPLRSYALPPALVRFWNEYFGGSRGSPVESFQLLKLHGSLNWYWDAISGGPPVDVRLDQTWDPEAQHVPDDELRYRAPGMEPFIVPPLATKSAYFRQAILRELWLRARGELEQAHTLYCVGYSVPVTDFSVRALLRAGQQINRIVVANPDPEVAARLKSVAPSDASIEHVGMEEDADPVGMLVAQYTSSRET